MNKMWFGALLFFICLVAYGRPSCTKVTKIDDYLNQKISARGGAFFKNGKLLGPKKSFSVCGLEKIQCFNCSELGTKNIKIVSMKKTYWLTADLAMEIEAIVSTRSFHPSKAPIGPEGFTKQKILTKNPSEYFLDMANMKFFQLQKVILPGTPLKKRDLIPVNLVQPGRPAKVLFNSQGLKLSLMAMPFNYGRFGDIIRLRNLRSSKVITGRVTHFNTVVLDL